MSYADHVYYFVEKECSKWDAIYEDYIIHLVGIFGLTALRERNLIESCGAVNGRKLYTLLDKK